MKTLVASSTKASEAEALSEICSELFHDNPEKISWLLIFHTEHYDTRRIVEEIDSRGITAPVHGGSTCYGIMSNTGFIHKEGRAIGAMALYDPAGSYGVGITEIGNDPEGAAGTALHQALERAGRPGEVPSTVWISAAPGREESLIAGIAGILGPNVPIVGGSTADNSISGKWSQFTNHATAVDAVVISVFFPSVDISQTFHSGYDPTGKTGIVTAAEGRVIHQIDYRPAAEVYNAWTGGLISPVLPTGGDIVPLTTLAPIGKKVALMHDVEYYRLAHPQMVTPDGSLLLFASFETGDRVTLMSGSRESLIPRAGRVVKAAMDAGNFDFQSVSGALIIYCAGCMLTIREDMELVAQEISRNLGNRPFLGIFTFGEQGQFEVCRINTHGNLMISSLIFSNRPKGSHSL